MLQDAQTDLFPWILGGLLVVAGAVPAAMHLTHAPPPAAIAVAAPANPGPSSPPAAGSSAGPAASVARATPAAAAESAPASPAPSQIWQCTVNGQKTFSDSPCGAGATLRQVSQVNRMDPTPAAHVPVYPQSPGVYYPPAPAEDVPSSNDIDAAPSVILINERRHDHRPPPHPHDRRPIQRN